VDTAQADQQWYAVRVKPRYEKVVAFAAHRKGFEEFVPLCIRRHRWSDRSKPVEVPLFPGYVFCRLKIEQRLALLTIPGVLHFVGIGKIPTPIDQDEIAAIQTAVQSESGILPWPFLDVGQRVRLTSGPMAGLEGLLIQVRDRRRFVIGLTILRRAIAVEIENHWAEPMDQSAVLPSVSLMNGRSSC
jgi:transcription antitermination factor NusG